MVGHDKIPLAQEKKLKFEGVFEIKELYTSLKDYLGNSRHYDVTEKDYAEKNVSGQKEIVSKNEAEQQFTDYYKIIIRYTIEMKGNDIEVEIDDKKKKMVKGIAILTINSYVQPDFLGKRGKGPLMEFITKVYDKYIGKDEFTKCAGSTAGDVKGLISVFKKQINSKIQ